MDLNRVIQKMVGGDFSVLVREFGFAGISFIMNGLGAARKDLENGPSTADVPSVIKMSGRLLPLRCPII
jgi:hypothetical protein